MVGGNGDPVHLLWSRESCPHYLLDVWQHRQRRDALPYLLPIIAWDRWRDCLWGHRRMRAFFLSLISCSNLENGGPCVSSGQHSRTSPNDVGVGTWLWKCESRRKPHPLLKSARGNQPWWSWRAHPGCEDKGELVGGWGNKTCSFQAHNQGYDLSQPNIYSIYELLKYLKAPNLQTQSCRITTMQANNRISKMTLSESPALLL